MKTLLYTNYCLGGPQMSHRLRDWSISIYQAMANSTHKLAKRLQPKHKQDRTLQHNFHFWAYSLSCLLRRHPIILNQSCRARGSFKGFTGGCKGHRCRVIAQSDTNQNHAHFVFLIDWTIALLGSTAVHWEVLSVMPPINQAFQHNRDISIILCGKASARAAENPESARSVIHAIFSAHSAYFNVSRQKVPYFNVSRQKVPYFNLSQQNRVIFNCFATKHAKDVRSGRPLFCNHPPRGPESEPEIARVTQRESEWARES